MKKDTALFFAPLTSSVLNDNRLKLPERAILSLLIQLSIKKGYCFANNKHFARNLNCSLSTVSKSIKQLRELGYITRNEPDPDHGGRSYRRYVRQDLFYNAALLDNKSSPVNSTKQTPDKTKYSIKCTNESNSIYLSESDEKDLVQKELKSTFLKWRFYNDCKKIYSEAYAIEWSRANIASLINLCNRVYQYCKTSIRITDSVTPNVVIDSFRLLLSCKPKYFTDQLPTTFLRFFDKIVSGKKFLSSMKHTGSKYSFI